MAIESVSVTPGSGKDIAVDTIGAKEYQVIKVSLGAEDAHDCLIDSGQQLMAASVPVVLASDHSDVKVTLDSEAVVLGAGTAGIGKLTANSGVDIGDVDVTSILPGVGATNLGKAEDAAHSSGDVGVMSLAVRQSSQADFGADGDYVPFSVDDDGGLRVSIVAGAGSGGTAAADDADFTAGTTAGTPAMGVYESSPTSVTDGDLGTVGITQTRALRTSVEGTVTVASHAVTNAGTFAVQVTGDALTALQLIDNAVSGSEFQVDVVAALPAGTNNIGDVDVASIAAGTNLIGDVGPQPRATGGLSVFRTLDLDETEEEIKATAGCLYKLRITNRTSSVRYVKLYNDTAANVIVGTTAPLDTIPVPANASDYTVLTESFGGMGLAFSAAICIAATTGFADNDTGAPGANDLIVSAYYK
jgi:hypothetical protein